MPGHTTGHPFNLQETPMRSSNPSQSQRDAYTITPPSTSSEHLVKFIRLPRLVVLLFVVFLIMEANIGHPAIRFASDGVPADPSYHCRYLTITGEIHTFEQVLPVVMMVKPRFRLSGWLMEKGSSLFR